MRVLALDIAKRAVGWACDSEVAGRPICGTWLPPKLDLDLGAVGQAFERRLFQKIRDEKIEHVVYEAPHMANSGRGSSQIFFNEETSLVLIGLAFCAMTIAYSAGVSHSKGHVATWRKAFLGKANWPDAKKAATLRCDQLGWKYDSVDAAESCGLWFWRKNQFDPSFTIPKPILPKD